MRRFRAGSFVKDEQLGIMLVRRGRVVNVAGFKAQAHVARHVGQKQADEQARFASAPIKFVETRIVLVAGHQRETRRAEPCLRPIRVLAEALQKDRRSHADRLQIAERGVGVGGFEMIKLFAVAENIARREKCFSKVAEIRRVIDAPDMRLNRA